VLHVHERHPSIRQAVTTNGSLYHMLANKDEALRIFGALVEVDVSLDFCDPARHNEFRRCAEAYSWALETIEECVTRGLMTTVVVLGTDETLDLRNLSELFDIAGSRQCFVRINIFRPTPGAHQVPLSYNVLKRALLWMLSRHSVVALADPLFAAIALGEERVDNSGRTSLRILPDGSITPSTYLVDHSYRAAHISDARIGGGLLSSVLLNTIGDVGRIPAACDPCAYRETCRGGAYDRRLLWFSDLLERDPYCPLRHEKDLASWRVTSAARLSTGPTVHDGYLPTLIFRPRPT
jgi:radical SAM protein with 4Fe4S-binding SPASM domain